MDVHGVAYMLGVLLTLWVDRPHTLIVQGVCGYTDRFCGDFCLNGACKKRSPPPPASSLPVPGDDASTNVDPNQFSGKMRTCLLLPAILPFTAARQENSNQ